MPHYDYDKDYPFAAFVTNLGKYNEGALVGEWVKFPTTAEELKKVFERIGIGAKDDFGQTYEEWFITDYDCYVDGLYDLLGEYANLDELKAHYTRGGLGDGTCKKFLYNLLNARLEPMRQRRAEWEKDIPAVYEILRKGCEKAREAAIQTMDEVRRAMKINYFDDPAFLEEQKKKFM